MEKPERKEEQGLKALVAQPSVEIVRGGCERRPKSLQWKSLQAGDRRSEQLRPREQYEHAELVVSCDAKVKNTACQCVSFEVRTTR